VAADRHLIVSADDLGLSAAVNEGIFEAHEHGVVTSASLMVRQSAAPAAAEALADHPDLAVGLHLDLGGRIYGDEVRPDRRWGVYGKITRKRRTPERAAVADECRRQLERFRELVGRDPTHLDSHRHAHDAEPVTAVAEALAAELEVPLRGRDRPGPLAPVRYEGRFYGRAPDGRPAPEAIAPNRLAELIRGLPAGWTEIGCHPAAGPVPTSSYDSERQIELQTLRDPHVKDLLNVTGVRLCSFAQVNRC
jgi:predicted glycoside hydrolase/deacetylase ChbG (UPF0249 family)